MFKFYLRQHFKVRTRYSHFLYCLLAVVLPHFLDAIPIAERPCGDVIPIADKPYDIVIYGGTPAGIMAAVQASRMGKSVVIIEPSNHLGGIISNGLSYIDRKNLNVTGGLAKEFFQQVWLYYQNPKGWHGEKTHITKRPLEVIKSTQTMWAFEPHVGELILTTMVTEAPISVAMNERLDRRKGIFKLGPVLKAIIMESGQAFIGKVFIDASYEGDLMAAAGISYVVGREDNSVYGETLNGIHPNRKPGPNAIKLDPYLIKGDPTSGLLPRLHIDQGGVQGSGDLGVPAYNYRMCLTDIPENRRLIEKPADYDEIKYEIVFRAIEAHLPKETFFKLDPLPNDKTDSNNNGPISTDYIGMNGDYPEGDYATRESIAKAHERWQRGLLWTLQNHPRVPAEVQTYYAPWGLSKDEFTDNDNWPRQLYVREARRMVSELVMTEKHALSVDKISDGVGYAFYPIDSHAVKYFLTPDGYMVTDGGLDVKIPGPYPLSYRAIVSKRQQCENLFVPACLSASHIAYSSIRMEPVFMMLGQVAGTAASLAVDLNIAVQDVPYEILLQQLMDNGQVVDTL